MTASPEHKRVFHLESVCMVFWGFFLQEIKIIFKNCFAIRNIGF